MIWLDFETRSECDLKTAGVYNYARHPSTQVICMSYAYDDEEVLTWKPGDPFPKDIWCHPIRAHNAAFERFIFWHVLKMDIPLEQFYCTAAQARANCAPGSLEDVGRFAGVEMRKDYRGAALVRACCVPPYNYSLIPELIEYCEQDVRAMRGQKRRQHVAHNPIRRLRHGDGDAKIIDQAPDQLLLGNDRSFLDHVVIANVEDSIRRFRGVDFVVSHRFLR